LKMFRVCLFHGWGPPTPSNQQKCETTLPLGFHHPNIRAWWWKKAFVHKYNVMELSLHFLP
jgi:hypothetical protein